jgi:hypothetical protein
MSHFNTDTDFETDFETDFSDSDSAFDSTNDPPINQLSFELAYAPDNGISEGGGIIELLKLFWLFPNNIIYSTRDTLIQSGFTTTFVNRVYAILKNYIRIRDWMTNNIQYSFSNYKQLNDPLNNFTTFKKGNERMLLCRGIWRWLTFNPENKLELILAVPPRHWAFGKSTEELPFTECIETITSIQFHKKYDEYHILHTPIALQWWFIVIQPFATREDTYYNTLEDILTAVQSTNMDIQHIKTKDVITISRLKNIINIYCELLNEYHKNAIGHEFKDRLPRRPNKRTRERRKRKLFKYGYTL